MEGEKEETKGPEATDVEFTEVPAGGGEAPKTEQAAPVKDNTVPPEPVIVEPPKAAPTASGTAKPLYNFADLFSEKQAKPKLPETGAPKVETIGPDGQPIPATDAPAPEGAPIEGEEKKVVAMTPDKARRAAKRYAMLYNMFNVTVAGAPWTFDDPNPKQYKLDDDEMEDWVEYWGDYIEEHGEMLPGWLPLALFMGALVFKKMGQMFAEKKKRKMQAQEAEQRRARQLIPFTQLDDDDDTEATDTASVAPEHAQCPECGNSFVKKRPEQKFCSKSCVAKYNNAVRKQMEQA